jgi:hypothetical protein
LNFRLFWLFLHIAAAIIAFGPTFVFPIIGSMIQKSPQNAHFAMELNHKIERGLVIPVALTMLVSGGGLIYSSRISPIGSWWLATGIVAYLIAIAIAIFIQLPATSKLIVMTATPPPPDAPPGPPPAMAALISRVRTFGIVLTVLLMTIIFCMVVKPGPTVGFTV